MNSTNYDDERSSLDVSINNISLPSKYISNGFLEVFTRYNGGHDNAVIEKICPDIKSFRAIGVQSDFFVGYNSYEYDEISSDTSLLCVQKLYQFSIDDSLFTDVNSRFFQYEKYKERGLKTVIDIDYLPRGEHSLTVDHQKLSNDSLFWEELDVIPFWKE